MFCVNKFHLESGYVLLHFHDNVSTFVRCLLCRNLPCVISQVSHPSYSSFNELRFIHIQKRKRAMKEFFNIFMNRMWMLMKLFKMTAVDLKLGRRECLFVFNLFYIMFLNNKHTYLTWKFCPGKRFQRVSDKTFFPISQSFRNELTFTVKRSKTLKVRFNVSLNSRALLPSLNLLQIKIWIFSTEWHIPNKK